MFIPSYFTKLIATLFVITSALVAGGRTAAASSCMPTTAGNLCSSYTLSGVTLTATSVNGNPVFGTPPSAAMTGQFDWEYTPGDFANGSGTFTSLIVPWTSHGMGSLLLTIDNTSLNGTLPGNIHSDGVDFMIAMNPGLSGRPKAPGLTMQPAPSTYGAATDGSTSGMLPAGVLRFPQSRCRRHFGGSAWVSSG